MDNVIHHSVQEKVNNLTVHSGNRKQFRCAFFNFKGGANATGAWSYRGVKTTVINDTHVRCNSSHLTSFVVLVSVVNDPGSTVSLFCYSYLLTIVDCMRTIADITAGLSHSCSLFYTLCTYITMIVCLQQFIQVMPIVISCILCVPPDSIGLHHLHWLQHFLLMFACLHCILLVIEVRSINRYKA